MYGGHHCTVHLSMLCCILQHRVKELQSGKGAGGGGGGGGGEQMIMAESPPLEVETAVLKGDDDLHYMHSMVP